MTLQVRTENGWTVTGSQIGPPDMAATLSSATSLWGWVNGMDGVRRVLAYFRNPLKEKRIGNVFTIPDLPPATSGIVTLAQGVVYLRDEESPTAFGGDARTQIFALSICALAHTITPQEAVIDLFMNWLAPALLCGITSEVGGVREALYAQLTDNYSIILNEGATRGLPQIFTQAVANLKLPANEANARQNWRDELLVQYGNSELSLVAGLLRWIGMEEKQTYLTRSSLVLKAAACFKSIGYIIGPLQTWKGSDNQPRPYGGVVLILSGSEPTDSFIPPAADFQPFAEYRLMFHYRYRTIGALLSSSIQNPCDIRPEIFQTLFESVAEMIEGKLTLTWTYNAEKDETCAKPSWRERAKHSSISIRLASIHFAHLAEHLASLYEDIADEKTLDAVLNMPADAINAKRKDDSSDRVTRFRAITASILLAITSRLAGRDYETLQHMTSLTMDNFEGISQVAKTVDAALASSISFSLAARLIAVFHCGIGITTYTRNYPQTIGWRSGIYTVMPALFFERAPNSRALGFRCKDEFFGNIPVHEEGRIIDITPPGIMEDEEVTQKLLKSTRRSTTPQIFFGLPRKAPPDVPLYLSIERRCNSADSSLCLCARIDGELVGTVSVLKVIKTIAQSLQTPPSCPSHTAPYQALNVAPSIWAKCSRCYKPSGSPHHTYIPVKDDRCWALYLAGEHRDWVTIGHGCFDCAVDVFAQRISRSTERRVRVIGYEQVDRPETHDGGHGSMSMVVGQSRIN